MEEDGGTSDKWQAMLAELLQDIDDPYAATAGEILDLLTKFGIYIQDSDDYIGSFGISMSMQAHKPSTFGIRAIDRCVQMPDPYPFPTPFTAYFRMNGDGSSYDLAVGFNWCGTATPFGASYVQHQSSLVVPRRLKKLPKRDEGSRAQDLTSGTLQRRGIRALIAFLLYGRTAPSQI